MVSQLPAAAEVQRLDVGAVPGKDQQGVVTDILKRTNYESRVGLFINSIQEEVML